MEKPGQSAPNSQGGAQQQNISINISYNLNTHKIPKAILGGKKHTSKSKKLNTPVMNSIGNQFFSNMAFNSLNQGKKSLKKQNLSKKSNEPSLAAKQPKTINEKKLAIKKKKNKQTLVTEPNIPPVDTVIEYYNPLANNSKNFLKRNIQSPDIFKVEYNRKLKTEASNYDPNESTFKKLKRSTGHMKQTESGFLGKNLKINNFIKDTGFNFIGQKTPASISTMLKKPSLNNSKTPKNRKSANQLKQKQKRMYTQQNDPTFNPSQGAQTRHNKSCMLYSVKKPTLIPQPHLIQAAQHILSTYVSTNSNPKLPRKRAQSAYSFNKNGKELVSKLLNMSMISEGLGSSQLITSERLRSARGEGMKKKLGLKVDQLDQFSHYGREQVEILEEGEGKIRAIREQYAEQTLPGNALRQYLNSIDLRIIKNIEDDTANITLSNKPQKPLFKSKQLPNNNSLTIPNKQSQKSQHPQLQSPNDVVSFYNKLFSNALYNKRIQEEQEKYLDSANLQSERQSSSIDFDESQKLKREHFVVQGFDDGNQEDEFNEEISGSINQTKDVYEFVKSTAKPEGSRKLNFQHYKDLLNKKSQQQHMEQTSGGFNFHLMGCENDQEDQQDQQDQQDHQQDQQEEENQFDFIPHHNNNISKPTQSIQNQRNPSHQQKSHSSSDRSDLQQKAIIQLIDKSFKPSESPSSGSSLSQLREEQVERWNHVNKMMTGKWNRSALNSGEVMMDEKEIVRELNKQAMKESQWMQDDDHQSCEEDHELAKNHEKQIIKEAHGLSDQEQDQESALISQQRAIINQSAVFFNNNNNNTKPSHNKQLKTSSRKNLPLEQPSYNQVCWQYNSDELDKEIQLYNSQNNQKDSQSVKKKPKPSRHVYNNSPNNFSQDGNGSGEEEYDSKKYSQVTLSRDQVREQQQDLNVEFFEHKLLSHEQIKNHQKDQQNSNSLIDSLADDEEDAEMSFEEKEIGSENRWINSSFVQQTFVDTQGRIKKFIEKKAEQQTHQKQTSQKTLEKSQDYLECDLSSFGVNNNNKNLPKNNTKTEPKQQNSLTQPPVLQKQCQAQQKPEIHQALSVLESQEKSNQVIESHFKLAINGKQTIQKITLQVEQSSQQKSNQNNNINSNDKKDAFLEIRRKRLTHIVEDIILEMIREFAKDISYILKKSSYEKRSQQQEMQENSSPFRSYKQSQHEQHELSPFSKQAQALQVMNSSQVSRKQQQLKKNQFVGKCFGIDTSFASVQKYLKQFKEYLLKDENMKRHIIKNINKDIGPNSLEILSYLRPQYDNMDNGEGNQGNPHEQPINQEDPCEDEDGLFVVPSQAFSEFQTYLEQQIDEQNKLLQPQKQIILTQKQKRNTNFWHRGIYESWNQFLDYERPYGINGKPYEWVKEKKKFRQVQLQEVEKKLQKGIDKLLQGISLPSGIIYDKYDLPQLYSDLNEEQKMYLNEERLSRMLAIELFESEETWINYNDEMAELLVQLGRIIEDRVFFEITTEMKKVFRKRNLLGGGGIQPLKEGNQQNDKSPLNDLEEQSDNEENNFQEDDQKWLVDERVEEQQEEEEEED